MALKHRKVVEETDNPIAVTLSANSFVFTVAKHFKDGDNIAGKCREPSGWRVDVDCDAPEAV